VRICHLSWEYPPVVYGGLGRHVFAIAREQARAGHDVVVIAHVGIDADDGTALPSDEVVDGVRVIRVVRDAPFVPFEAETLLGWISGLASAMTRTGLELGGKWSADVVHAHDWLTAHAGSLVSRAWGVPWVHTIHATEAGRHQGWLPGALSRAIHSIEGWSVHEADRILVCSEHMKWEVDRLFDMADSVVIPNGVDTSAGLVDTSLRDEIRSRFPGPLIVHTGRLEWEKGAHTIIEALPRIKKYAPDVQCVIAGRGSQTESLIDLAKRKRVASRVHVDGWLPEAHLRALVAAADVAIVPSLYEPFGIVALEAASVGIPVVAARSGGLIEFLNDDAYGWGFAAGDATDLARAVRDALEDPAEAQRRAANALDHVRRNHSWAAIAERTVQEYSCDPTAESSVAWTYSTTSPERNLLFDVR
jgi:glycogen synthase